MAISNNVNSYLDNALAAAEAAAPEILKYYHTDSQLKNRAGEPVTWADTASEKELSAQLQTNPKIGYLSEESNTKIPDSDFFWIVDPLDGTSDFLKENGEFVIMIGLVEQNQSVFGLIYQPLTKIYYYAAKGQGAYMVKNTRKTKLRASHQANPAQAIVYISRSHLLETDKMIFKQLDVAQQIPMGSALKSCKIADGKGDIYINTSKKTGKWDVCAADIIVSEAGGKFTNLQGNKIDYREPGPNKLGFLASNNFLHQPVLEVANSVLLNS